MIYKTLRKLPMITCVEIIEDTSKVYLLSDDDETSIDELNEIWEPLFEEYKEKYGSKDNKNVFNLSKEIKYLENKYFSIQLAVDALRFDKHENLINMLIEFGYKLRHENYNEDLNRIERVSSGIILKIKMFQDQLPKENENNNTDDAANSIVNIMAGYSSILGYDFDFYTISVEKFYSLEKQVKNKIAIIEKQNAKTK